MHTASGKLIVVLTNEAAYDFTTFVGTTDGVQRVWAGFSFQGASNSSTFNITLGAKTTSGVTQGQFETMLAPFTVQWWYEQ